MIGAFVQINLDTVRSASHPIGYVVQESGCWEWVGGMSDVGYGLYTNKKKTMGAHRMMFMRSGGVIPEGMVLDHLCRNRACVRPDHLEVVTHRENLLRGEGKCAKLARKTHCVRGHLLPTKPNKDRGHGERRCWECVRLHTLICRAENIWAKEDLGVSLRSIYSKVPRHR